MRTQSMANECTPASERTWQLTASLGLRRLVVGVRKAAPDPLARHRAQPARARARAQGRARWNWQVDVDVERGNSPFAISSPESDPHPYEFCTRTVQVRDPRSERVVPLIPRSEGSTLMDVHLPCSDFSFPSAHLHTVRCVGHGHEPSTSYLIP